MKIRTDFVTNSSSSSFVACGVLSQELADFIKELLNGNTSAFSQKQLGKLEVSNDIVSVTTILDTINNGKYYINAATENDRDLRSSKEKAADNREALKPQNISSAISAFLPSMSSLQKNKLETLVAEASADKKTTAKVYVDQTDGFENQVFGAWDFNAGLPVYRNSPSARYWIEKYGHLIDINPLIYFPNSVFVFSGFGDHGSLSNPLVAKTIKRGGTLRKSVSGKTNYLVVDPEVAGESQIQAVETLREKGILVDVILLKDFKKALNAKCSAAQEEEIRKKVFALREKKGQKTVEPTEKKQGTSVVSNTISAGPIAGKIIAVTGELVNFPEYGKYPERIKFRALVEKHGGKLGSSITKKTDFLVCNDTSKATTKVKQAKENNVPIISEQEFLNLIAEKK